MAQNTPTPETDSTMQGGSNNVTLTAAEYMHYLEIMRQQGKQAEPAKRTTSPDRSDEEKETKGNLRGNPPKVFTGDRTKSRSFISDLQVYFQLNRRHTDVRNCYSRVLIALSFIKGDDVVNWVNAQLINLNDDLKTNYDDEHHEDLWENFISKFNANYVSTTLKEEALVRMGNLKMEGTKLDEYITEHATLIALLGWHQSSDIAAEHFRMGLTDPLARKIIDNHDLPTTTKAWVELARKYHTRYTVARAFGYTGRKDKPKGDKKPFHQYSNKPKERDPNAMEVDAAQATYRRPMDPEKRERIMREGLCFKCEKKGHLSKDCPTRRTAIQEAKVETPKEPTKGKTKEEAAPPSYDSLAKSIAMCSMADRQKLMETLSSAGDSDTEQDF